MIEIPRTLLKQINEGLEDKRALERLLYKYPINDVISSFAELILVADEYMNRPQIAVTESEYQQIVSLFKIKGQRVLDGKVIAETRGRKPNKILKG